MSMIGAKEIIRPGIAGPFWSDIQFGYDGPIDVTEWMLDILERRQGPEPSDMPYNGLDFYLHELCDGSLNAIARMLKSGHKALALETATETHGVVAGMKDMLLDLGDDADLVFAHGAWEHLARYYQCLHPKATQCAEIQHYPQWALGADAFVIRQGGGDTFRDLMIIYPAGGQFLDDTQAWALIDRALPQALRGGLSETNLSPVRLGPEIRHEFATGAIVTLTGDPDRRTWTQIEIIGRGLQEHWDPRLRSEA